MPNRKYFLSVEKNPQGQTKSSSVPFWYSVRFLVAEIWGKLSMSVGQSTAIAVPPAPNCVPSFQKIPKIPNIPKIKNLQNRPENQQLGPKLIQDDSPSLNNPFPTIFGQFPSKNPPKISKIPENPLTSMP